MKELTSFASGEVTPKIFGRISLTKYQNGASIIENYLNIPHGGLQKRTGLRYVGQIADMSKVPFLKRFQYSEDESYALGFEENSIRIYADGGVVSEAAKNITAATAANPCEITSAGHGYSNGDKIIVNSISGMTELNNREFTVSNITANTFELSGIDSGAYSTYVSGGTCSKIVEVVTNYLESELHSLRFAQQKDVLYIGHKNHALAKLSRSSNTNWTLSDIELTDGPFRDINGDQTKKFYIAIDSTTTNISGATRADPVVITTATDHGYKSGDCITFSSVVGMTNLNGNRYFIVKLSDTTFSLRDESYRDINGTAYGAYTSGGACNRSVTKWGTYSEGATNFSLTTDFSYFHSDMVGQLIRLNEPGQQTGIATPVTDSAISNSSVITNDAKVYGLNGLTGATLWDADWNLPNHETGVVKAANSKNSQSTDLVFLHDVTCVVKITAVTNSTSATCEIVLNHMPADVITYGTSAWEEGAWSDYHGYPSAIGFDGQRLVAGGTTRDKDTGWMSVTNAFESFADGDEDNASIAFTVASEDLERIAWFSSGSVLAMGTFGSEHVIKSGENGKGITPSNISAKQQTNYGSTMYEPVRAGDALVFAARFGKNSNAGKKLREFDYNFEQDKHKAPPLTIISEHISGPGFTQLCFSQEPIPIIWALRSDGQLVSCTYERDQDVVAFNRQIAGGSFDGGNAVIDTHCVVPGDYGDEWWACVKRTIDGQTVRYIEYMSREMEVTDENQDIVFHDSSVVYDGAATTTLSGLWHLRGETIGIKGDGSRQLDQVVSDTGKITIDSASKVHVGYKIQSKFHSLPIESQFKTGSTQGTIKRISKMFLRVYRSLGGTVGINNSEMDDLTYRGGDQLSPQASPELYTGLVEISSPGGWDRELIIKHEHEDPYPETILGILAEMGK